MTQKRFKKEIFIFALISIFFSTLLITFSIKIKTLPNNNEKVDILFTGYSYNSKRDELNNILKNSCESYIKKIDISFVSLETDENYFNNQLISIMDDVDIFVLPEPLVKTKFPHLRLEFQKENFITLIGHPINDDFYIEDGKYYGACFYDSKSKKGFINNYLEYENDKNNFNYYLFLNKNSPQLGAFNNLKLKGCIDVARKLFSL